MRKSVILLICAAAVLVTGCDFFRVLAGRPTSGDIDSKRVEIIKSEEAALQAHLDSLRKAEEKVVSDSLSALDSLAAQGVIISDASRLGGLSADDQAARYCIVIGVFRDRNNAAKLVSKAEEDGVPASLIECRRGMIAVGVCPSDRIAEVYEDWRKLQEKTYCPKDSWILLDE